MKKLMCYVGLNPVGGSNTSNGIAETEKPHGGGIAVFEVGLDGCSLNYLESVPFPGLTTTSVFLRSSSIVSGCTQWVSTTFGLFIFYLRLLCFLAQP